MTNPASADRVLVALAERASKRRGVTVDYSRASKKPKNKVEDLTEEVVDNNFEDSYEENNNIEDTLVEDSKNEIEDNLEVEVEPTEESYSSKPRKVQTTKEALIKSEAKGITRFNETKRKAVSKKPYRNSPEMANDFDEQVEIVGTLLQEKLQRNQNISALKLTQDWIDCLLDDNDVLYEGIYDRLSTLPKEQLISYIRILISSLK